MAFFLSGLPRRSRMVNGARAGNYRRITHHPPADQHRPAQRPLYLCLDGKEEMGWEVVAIVRLGRLLTGFTGAYFLLATNSPVHVIQPSVWPAPLVLLPFLCAKGGADLQGLSLLDL